MEFTMIPLYSQQEISLRIAENVRQQSLTRNLTQEELSSKSGVPLGTLRVFERTGRISLGGLVKIAMALGEEPSLLRLMEQTAPASLFAEKQPPRKRIRASRRKGERHS
jgi:transcriptional regulator with XRE-family HTH domain